MQTITLNLPDTVQPHAHLVVVSRSGFAADARTMDILRVSPWLGSRGLAARPRATIPVLGCTCTLLLSIVEVCMAGLR